MAGNYRPVSLTCLASKLMESCVKDAMLKHVLENKGSLLSNKFVRNF